MINKGKSWSIMTYLCGHPLSYFLQLSGYVKANSSEDPILRRPCSLWGAPTPTASLAFAHQRRFRSPARRSCAQSLNTCAEPAASEDDSPTSPRSVVLLDTLPNSLCFRFAWNSPFSWSIRPPILPRNQSVKQAFATHHTRTPKNSDNTNWPRSLFGLIQLSASNSRRKPLG